MASDDEVAVFIDTNLGTHLAMSVSPNNTVGDFQRELERTHHSCFPELGKLEVHASMVRRKSCFYHLPSSMPIKYAFQHKLGAWFLQIEARTLKDSDGPCLSNFAAIEVGDRKCNDSRLTNSLVRNTKEGTRIGRDASKCNSGSMTKNRTRAVSAGRAMQGLPEEQLRTKADNSYCSSIQIGASPPFMVRTPPKQSLFHSPADQDTGTRRDKFGSSGIGKRVVVASNNIRISDEQKPKTPLSNFRDRKLLCYKNLCRAKFLVFEISDSE